MTFNQTSSIRFSVEESVWFKKGQEVSDLIAISLDPEISVQEHEDYISIRGALVLSGEYHPAAKEEGDQEIFSLRDTAIYRTVDEVVESESGIHCMKHRFPIDITIPTNRIRSLEDVYVLIEAFDYEIPERGRLELKADLCISGIANERASSMAAQKQASEAETEAQPAANERYAEASSLNNEAQPEGEFEEQTVLFRQNIFDSMKKPKDDAEKTEVLKFPSFTTEVRKEANDEEFEENIEENEVTSFSTVSFISAREEASFRAGGYNEANNETNNEVSEAETGQVLGVVEAEAVSELREEVDAGRGSGNQAEAEVEPEIPVNLVEKKISPQIGMKGRSEQREQEWNPKSLYSPQQTTYTSSGSRENIEESMQAESPQRSKRTENALYLTKMLSSTGEEDFSKLRLRIVQSGETIGTIAETYDISANQIIRLNDLSDDALKAGQILYIPAYAGVEK